MSPERSDHRRAAAPFDQPEGIWVIAVYDDDPAGAAEALLAVLAAALPQRKGDDLATDEEAA